MCQPLATRGISPAASERRGRGVCHGLLVSCPGNSRATESTEALAPAKDTTLGRVQAAEGCRAGARRTHERPPRPPVCGPSPRTVRQETVQGAPRSRHRRSHPRRALPSLPNRQSNLQRAPRMRSLRSPPRLHPTPPAGNPLRTAALLSRSPRLFSIGYMRQQTPLQTPLQTNCLCPHVP